MTGRRAKFPPIIFMDLEGTLLRKQYHLDNGKVAPSAWTLLAEKLGPNCLVEEERTKDRWLNGGYNGYVEWMKDTIEIHRKHSLTSTIFEEVIQSSELISGVEFAINYFKSKGSITAIISGGFKALADRVQRRLKIDHALAGCEYFFSPQNGRIEHFNLLPSDEEGKVDFMLLIAKEHGVNPNECVFIGDGKNDVHLAQNVGFSIAFNAQKELAEVSSARIKQDKGFEDFGAVIKVIEERWNAS